MGLLRLQCLACILVSHSLPLDSGSCSHKLNQVATLPSRVGDSHLQAMLQHQVRLRLILRLDDAKPAPGSERIRFHAAWPPSLYVIRLIDNTIILPFLWEQFFQLEVSP